MLPSPQYAGNTPGCGKALRASDTTSCGKLHEGLRLIAGQRKKSEDWVIRRRPPKPVSVGHGGVSETGKVWVTDEGIASLRWLKVQSGPRGNSWD